jgi:putative redox protein
MVTISIDYQGDLHCRATHGPSGAELSTDAPADNMGRGEAFSPTDLVATALGTCILTTMAIKAQSMGIDLFGAKVCVEKEMTSSPRRIGALTTKLVIPVQVAERDRKVLEATAHACPVHKSLSPEVEMPITFEWAL